jgi:hypothetical protein
VEAHQWPVARHVPLRKERSSSAESDTKPMSRDDWEQALARAVVERTFRARLLTDPVDALTDYGLRESEAHVMGAIRARTLPELAASLRRLIAIPWPTPFDGFVADFEFPF